MRAVILAGGAGRRFGDLKQLIPVAPDGRSLLEITLRDCHRTGCRHGVVVTSPALVSRLEDRLRARPLPGMEITIAVQDPEDLPAHAPAREKPWGTAHAVWAARKVVDGPFLLFNADDHYGPRAPWQLRDVLEGSPEAAICGLLGYRLGATLAARGSVSRALCLIDDSGYLKDLREYPAINPEGRVAEGPEAGRILDRDALVSMNAWAFTPAIFPILAEHLRHFLATADLENDECYLPAAVNAAVEAGQIRVRVPMARDRWFGMTWPEDRVAVAAELAARDDAEQVAAALLPGTGTPLVAALGEGLIHRTWSVETPDGPLVLQRLNEAVFPDPVALAANAATAARRVDRALTALGDQDARHRLQFLEIPAGGYCHRDGDGGHWRMARFIPQSRPASEREGRAAARALGRFPGLAACEKGEDLVEILPGFHDTEVRLAAWRAAVAADNQERAEGCAPEIAALEATAELATRLSARDLPQRTVHNDAKLDNVLVDRDSGEVLCVIDLDTVMPGLAAWDFGDLVRSAVSGRPEDEIDLDAIKVRREFFHELAAGYLEGARGWITPLEIASLVDGALVITYEQALRFLTDHLAGDGYYGVREEGHNLRRTRAQIRLLNEMIAAEDSLRRLVDNALQD